MKMEYIGKGTRKYTILQKRKGTRYGLDKLFRMKNKLLNGYLIKLQKLWITCMTKKLLIWV